MIKGVQITESTNSNLLNSFWLLDEAKNEARCIASKGNVYKEDEVVAIYKIGDIDFQICGGPHVKNTNQLGHFKIAKQEAVSSGVRRLKAILEN